MTAPARLHLRLALSLGALALSGCTLPCERLGGSTMLEYQLYFGRGNVTDQEWSDFTGQVVTPSLPNGFTVLDAEGQWLNPGNQQISRERTKVLIVAVPENPVTASAIARIKDEYRARFRQISVGTTIHPVCAAF